MKKTINGLVLGIVSLGLLCGCGSKSDEYAEKFIELYCNSEYQYVDENKTITSTIKEIYKEDNEEHDYEIIADKNGNIVIKDLKKKWRYRISL